MAQNTIMVSIGTDGVTNWIRLPNGRKVNMGSVSVLNFVVKASFLDSSRIRKLLDSFNAGKEILLKVNQTKMMHILVGDRRRAFWASDDLLNWDPNSFMPLVGMDCVGTYQRSGSMRDDSKFSLGNINIIEAADEKSDAEIILNKMSFVANRINALESAGKRFNSKKARLDTYDIVCKVAKSASGVYELTSRDLDRAQYLYDIFS